MAQIVTDSILTSVKESMGITEDYKYYDSQLVLFINSVFSTLTQLGVGPVEGFSISDDTTTWSDYLGDNQILNLVQTYMALSVRTLFDPPSSSFVLESIKTKIQELEWRINVTVDPTNTFIEV